MEAELSRLRYPFFWRRFEGVVNHYDDSMCLRLHQSQNISVTTQDLHELIHIFGAGVGDGQQLGEVVHLPAQRHHESRHYPRCPPTCRQWSWPRTGARCRAVLYCTVLYCTVLYCTVLYCTVLYCLPTCRQWSWPRTAARCRAPPPPGTAAPALPARSSGPRARAQQPAG